MTNLSTITSMTGADYVRQAGSAIAVAPANREELARVLGFAHQQQSAVVPWGAGTKQGWGYAVTPAVVLEMRRMDAVTEHTWQDMTCSVQAGCPWASMQRTLAQHGQCVALDPLWPERATVGGVIATNDSGALRLRYGGLRDLIIGMTIVLADGTMALTGGKVVKNVAGYDLHKLMIGAFGTLAVIASVNFRLHSLPQCRQSFTLTGEVAPLARVMLTLLHAQLSVEALQLRGDASGFALDVQLASLAEVVRTQGATLENVAQGEGVRAHAAADEVWAARQQMFAADILCKATMLPAEIARFAERVRSLAGQSVTQATGIMTAGFPVAAAGQLAGLRKDLEASGGSMMVLQQPPEVQLDCWGSLPDSVALMREVKRRFDPQGILNPGRFVGGI